MKTLCLDFDGVIHSYSSGWLGADVVIDPPVPGAIEFILDAMSDFRIAIYSSRSHQSGGMGAMQAWLIRQFEKHFGEPEFEASDRTLSLVYDKIEWPREKPAAHVTLDDRAIQFDGKWPNRETLINFKPWNKR